MAAGTKVQLRLGERVVAEVSFREDELRIGRMKENDLVINNLAVSRFHAALRRVGDGFEIEDLGSENGTFVNGVPVKGRVAVAPGAEIAIGKHVLSIRSGADDEENLPAPRTPVKKSDAWDAGQTYLMPGAPAPAAEAKPPASEPMSAPAAEAEVLAEAMEEPESDVPANLDPAPPAAAHDRPDPAGLFAFGEDELQLAPPAAVLEPAPELVAEFDVAAPEAGAEPKGQTALFDFGATSDLGLSEPSLARVAAQRAAAAVQPVPQPTPEPAPPAAKPAPAASGYAGLIVARKGKVERVAPFSGPELIAGRGNTCELVLPAAGVSRRHARFVREGETFRVVDLGSANGVRVNGERATDRVLHVGDIVAIDDFTLTFVIDREPIDATVSSPPRAPAAPAAAANVTVLHDAPLATMMEQDVLLTAEEEPLPLEDGEKELESVAEASMVASGVAELGPDWVVEVVIAPEQLPPPLRAALRELGQDALRLPGELRLRKR
jgi:pSer/pThr/pTyr-binding forkhead associated (FHA) protein